MKYMNESHTNNGRFDRFVARFGFYAKCPWCKLVIIPKSLKLVLGPIFDIRCPACQKKVGAPNGTRFIVLLVFGIAFVVAKYHMQLSDDAMRLFLSLSIAIMMAIEYLFIPYEPKL
jgi:hypothetical protein